MQGRRRETICRSQPLRDATGNFISWRNLCGKPGGQNKTDRNPCGEEPEMTLQIRTSAERNLKIPVQIRTSAERKRHFTSRMCLDTGGLRQSARHEATAMRPCSETDWHAKATCNLLEKTSRHQVDLKRCRTQCFWNHSSRDHLGFVWLSGPWWPFSCKECGRPIEFL